MELVNSNIKWYRKKNHITLRDLAKKLGVSASFLSQIETGKTTPSLATLKKIADTLQTTIGTLMGEEKAAPKSPLVRKDQRQPVKEIGSGLKIDLLASHDPYMQMEPSLFTFNINGNTGELSQHFGQEFLFVLEGKLEVTLSNDTYILNDGDSFFFNSYLPHRFVNIHQDTTRVLRIITPPIFI